MQLLFFLDFGQLLRNPHGIYLAAQQLGQYKDLSHV
jgi:hypothetical protein